MVGRVWPPYGRRGPGTTRAPKPIAAALRRLVGQPVSDATGCALFSVPEDIINLAESLKREHLGLKRVIIARYIH